MKRVIRLEITIPDDGSEPFADVEMYDLHEYVGQRQYYIRDRVAFFEPITQGAARPSSNHLRTSIEVAMDTWCVERACLHEPGVECFKRMMPAGVFQTGSPPAL